MPDSMPDLQFSQAERRNPTLPILIALAILGLAFALAAHFFPHTAPSLSVTRATAFPTHTVIKTDSIVVGHDPAEDDLYVLTTLHIDNPTRVPLFLKDFTAALITSDGQQVESSAIEKNDLPTVYLTFPAIKPLTSTPLLRETQIDPAHSAEGMVLLHFPVTQAVWDARASATLTTAFYHQAPITIPIPKS